MLALAARVAGWGLSPDPVPGGAVHPGEWDELFGIICHHRLTGLLRRAVRDGGLELTPDEERDLLEVHRFLVGRALKLESVMVELCHQLTQLPIEYRVLKGPALANTIYPDPATRPYVDIDLLVRAEDLDRAAEWLERSGARRVRVEPRPGFVSRYGKSIEFVRPDGVSVDLHCSLAPGVWALLIDADALFRNASDVPVLNTSLFGLGPRERFLHACYHATVGSIGLRLLALRDVLQCAAAPDFDWEDALELAREWSGLTVVAVAVHRASTFLTPHRSSPMLEWAVSHVPSTRDVRLFAIRSGIAESPGTDDIFRMVMAINGPLNKLRYLTALALPTTEYLAERGQTRRTRLARGARLIRRQGS
jgi:hypothetical protein